MASNWKATGGAGRLYIEATEGTKDAANNRSIVNWKLRLVEYSTSNTTWYGSPIAASVNVGGGGIIEWEGTFLLDWRGSGKTDQTIAQGSTWVTHLPDGSMPSVGVAGWIDYTHTVGAGGPTTVVVTLPLTTLKVIPGKPTGVTATRVSDTQINLSWSQSSASNGQPTSNTIQKRVNGGAWETVVTISPATSTTVSAAANQKLEFRVRGNNSAGSSDWSDPSDPIYTTPAPPTNVSAVKNSSLNIVITWTKHAAYSEHEHEVWHGTVTGGVTTWDDEPLATVIPVLAQYTHTAPDSGEVHIYRVRATAGTLASAFATSNAVQLLAAPNKPSMPALPPFVDRASAFVLTWTHNPVDTTPQSAYEVQYSTNGGSSWSSTGKVASATSQRSFAGGTYSAGTTLTVRVRTWGEATTGGSDGNGASPWSDTRAVTFKTRPVATIITPADEGTVEQALVQVQLGFSQSEGASFVAAELQLVHDAAVIETKQTTNLSTTLDTRVADGGEYTLQATVRDSNGIVSSVVEATFTVEYAAPVAASFTLTYLEETGWTQIDLTIPEPEEGEAEAVEVAITRSIDGVTETVVAPYPASSELTFLDTTPTVAGENVYTVTTISLDGSDRDVVDTLTTAEPRRAFLSKGAGFEQVAVFGANLRQQITPTVDQTLVKTAGRSRPIGLYGKTGDLVVAVTSTLDSRFGSMPDEIGALLLTPGRSCYRDPSGLRVFGQAAGAISRRNAREGELQLTVTETS